jgi:hypothetical protein
MKKSKRVRELLDKLLEIGLPNMLQASATVRQTMLRNNPPTPEEKKRRKKREGALLLLFLDFLTHS